MPVTRGNYYRVIREKLPCRIMVNKTWKNDNWEGYINKIWYNIERIL